MFLLAPFSRLLATLEPPVLPTISPNIQPVEFVIGDVAPDAIHLVGVELSRLRPSGPITCWIERIRPANNRDATITAAGVLQAQLGTRKQELLPVVTAEPLVLAAVTTESPVRVWLFPSTGPESAIEAILPEGDHYLFVTIAVKADGATVHRDFRLRIDTRSAQVALDKDGIVSPVSTYLPGRSWVGLVGGSMIGWGAVLYFLDSDLADALVTSGLVLDILGFILLSKSSLVREELRIGGMVLGGGVPLGDANPQQRERDRETVRARWGFILIIAGVFGQLFGQLVGQ